MTQHADKLYFYPAVIYDSLGSRILTQRCLSKLFCLLKLKHSEQQRGCEDINPMMTGHRQSMWSNTWKMSCTKYLNGERGKRLNMSKLKDLRAQNDTFLVNYTKFGLNFKQHAWEDVSSFVLCSLGLHPLLNPKIFTLCFRHSEKWTWIWKWHYWSRLRLNPVSLSWYTFWFRQYSVEPLIRFYKYVCEWWFRL